MFVRIFILPFLALWLCGCGRPGPSASEEAQQPVREGAAAADSNSLNKTQTDALLVDLTQAVRRYAAEQRRVPTSLDELVTSGHLSQVPAAPAGKQFAISKSLQVTLVDR